MICPACYSHVPRAHTLNLRERLITVFSPYKTYRCEECGWRGLLSATGLSTLQQFKQSLLGWLIGVVLALGIAWFVVGDLQNSTISPSAASAEMKWGW